MDNSHLAPTHLPARNLSPWLIVKVLLRGLKGYCKSILAHFSGLNLLARSFSFNSGRVVWLTEKSKWSRCAHDSGRVVSLAEKGARGEGNQPQISDLSNTISHQNVSLLSVVILTKNEEANLPASLASLRQLEAEVFVVDSGSSDRTVEIAKVAGCQVVEHPFENQAKQLNWALENLPLSTPWIMRLDADERLTPKLVEELKRVLPQTAEEITGYQVKRRVFFMGRWIRHGGYYPTWLLRIWRTGVGTCEQRCMDEHIVLSRGKIANLQHDIIDENHKGLSFWTDKHNRYADREVKDLLSDRSDDLLKGTQFSQASRRRWVKANLYARSPLFFRAFFYFLMRYTIGLGFLDGVEGLIFHFLQGFWYRFLIDAKVYELQKDEGKAHLL